MRGGGAILFLGISLLCLVNSKEWRAAVMADVHVNVNYHPDITEDTYCEMNKTGVKYTKEIS